MVSRNQSKHTQVDSVIKIDKIQNLIRKNGFERSFCSLRPFGFECMVLNLLTMFLMVNILIFFSLILYSQLNVRNKLFSHISTNFSRPMIVKIHTCISKKKQK